MLNIVQIVQGTLLSAASQLPDNTSGIIFFGVFIIAIGIFSVVYPQTFWHLRVGRKIPGVPPNKLYLVVLRIGGLLTILLGIYVIIYLRQLAL
jgi:hypothetical protein